MDIQAYNPLASGNSNGKRIAGALAILATAGITGYAVYYVFIRKGTDGNTLFKKWTGKAVAPSAANTTSTTQSTKTNTASPGGFPIGLGGGTTAQVMAIQKYLNGTNVPGTPISVDGVFGSQTANALKNAGYGTSVSQSDFQRMTA